MKLIKREDKLFPKKLKDITPVVNQIYVEGNIDILNNFGIAIVGSRNCSKDGEKTAKEFSKKISKTQTNIISGLAKGIDSIAHSECISYGGKTIAVIGSGLNNIYPKENIKLYEQIIESGGAVISEYEPNEPPNSPNFPMRNRIISGLSDGIIVIEGKKRSGTTITAEFGFKYNKKIFCIPHSIYDSYGTGPNSLIKKGASLITKPEEIINFFGLKLSEKNTTYNDEILLLLKDEILSKEEIAMKINKPISEVNQKITMLELEEKIEEIFGKGYRIIE